MVSEPVKVTRNHLHRLTHRLREGLPMWVVYNPTTREYPGVWVARMHISLPGPRPTRFVMTHDDLDGLRALLPPWLTRLARTANDAPEIVEVWL